MKNASVTKFGTTTTRRGFTLIELLVVIVIIGILAAIALPNYIKVKDKAKEAEVKSNLHNIQLSVERFAVDSEGSYPNYLTGGEPKYANTVDPSSGASFADVQDCSPVEAVADPLLRKAYVTSYPRNPFTRNGIALHQLQTDLPTSSSADDPLRNATDSGRSYGTRFGPYCTTMGQVYAEPRYRLWSYTDLNDPSNSGDRYTYAYIEYSFWDMWQSNKPLPFLPGQFFFKGAGPIVASAGNDASQAPIIPTETDEYMLGGFGSIRTKGKDIIGAERQITYMLRGSADDSKWFQEASSGYSGAQPMQAEPAGPVAPGDGSSVASSLLIWPWTRSQDSASSYDGSPFQPANQGDSNDQLQYGNPNGIRDGLVLVLTAGEDGIGDR